MKKMNFLNPKFALPALLISISASYTTPVFAQSKTESKNFELNKNLDIFYGVVRELDQFYVDSIKSEKLIKSGIDAMLSTLDPYTNYITETDLDDFKFMTTGEYGGIGSLIAVKDGKVLISEPYEGLPAAKNGLKPGDIILAIDGTPMSQKKVEDASSLLKGEANTYVTLTVKRFDTGKEEDIKIKREKIQINSIAYSGTVAPKVGYIQISSFTDKTGEEFKTAFLDLKKKGIEALIIDLRGNGGGVMEEALKVINYFVPKGEEVLSTRGKIRQWDRVYKTTLEPLDTTIPIAVMVDQGSASASEIVSGALQDLDRAVVIGNRTFGKGLVQTARSLSFNGNLKLTTAKYYTPSGRCVQAIDYSHRNADGSVGEIPDSLTSEFKTKNGRIVRDGGGITPDIKTTVKTPPNILFYLVNDLILFDFANEYAASHPQIASPKEFKFSDEDYEDFKKFVIAKDFKYDRQSEKFLAKLKEVAQFEGYMEGAEEEFKALENKLSHDLNRSLDTFRPEIEEYLSAEIMKRYYYQKGAIEYQLQYDDELKKTTEILSDPEQISEILVIKNK
ncbi:MAG: S41 family peptidase [Bacteroidales bacterium]